VFLVILSFIPRGIEPLTEVYFENHTKLPANVFLNRDYNFSFTVHNLEYEDVNYRYSVKAEYNETSVDIDSGGIFLANNESKSIYESFSFKEHFSRAKVEVIVSKNETDSIDIHFWVDEITGPTLTITP
jgi:hypothetical protein